MSNDLTDSITQMVTNTTGKTLCFFDITIGGDPGEVMNCVIHDVVH